MMYIHCHIGLRMNLVKKRVKIRWSEKKKGETWFTKESKIIWWNGNLQYTLLNKTNYHQTDSINNQNNNTRHRLREIVITSQQFKINLPLSLPLSQADLKFFSQPQYYLVQPIKLIRQRKCSSYYIVMYLMTIYI